MTSTLTQKSKFADRGLWAQGQAQDWLEAQSKRDASFAYHRYPDARAARGALAAQPADFLVAFAESGWHLEVKECKNAKRLPRDKVSQYGKLKMFSWAGFYTRVLVYRSELDDWVFLKDDDLFKYDQVPPSFLMDGLTSYPDADSALHAIFPV